MGPVVLDTPPSAYHAPASNQARVSQAEADVALARLRQANPGTPFESAVPSQVPGFIKITMTGGKLAYTDKTGRYLFMGVVFDMTAGKPLDGALDATNMPSTGEPQHDD